MDKTYQLVLDQSTSGTKLLLFQEGKILQRYDKNIAKFIQKSGGSNMIPSRFGKMSKNCWHKCFKNKRSLQIKSFPCH